jgi:predicted nucleotidyltransferase
MSSATASARLSRQGVLQALANDRDSLREFGVRRLALFGSAARDEAGAESDVDVLVVFERKSFRAYVGLLRHLEGLLGRRVDLVIEEALKPAIRDRILAEKVDVPIG